MLSKTARRQLKSWYNFTDEDIAIFENPTRPSVMRFIRRVERQAYDQGYHRAIDDLKEIVGNVGKLREMEKRNDDRRPD